MIRNHYLQCNIEEYQEASVFKQNPLWNRLSFVRVKQGKISNHGGCNEKCNGEIPQCNRWISWVLALDAILASYWRSRSRL